MDFKKMPKENEVFWKETGKYDATCKNCGIRREFGGNTKTAVQCRECGAGYNPLTGKRAKYIENELVDLEDDKWDPGVLSYGKAQRDMENEEDSEEKDSEELTVKELKRRKEAKKRNKEADLRAASSIDAFLGKLDKNEEPQPKKKSAKKEEAKKPEAKKSEATPKKEEAVKTPKSSDDKTTKSSDDKHAFIELDKDISVAELMKLIKSNSSGSSRIIMVEKGDILSYGDKLYLVQ